jgi:plasmid stability protein
MTDITVRKVDDLVIDKLTAEAEHKGISREALIKQILELHAAQIGIPQKGYKGYAANGAEVLLRNNLNSVTGTGKNMSQDQAGALKRAELMCDPKNGSKWAEARKLLEAVGFEIYEL